MKYLLLFPLCAVVFFSNSCRTVPPLNPNTMKQSCACMPANYHAQGPTDCYTSVDHSSK